MADRLDVRSVSEEEYRREPSLGGKAVTFKEMCQLPRLKGFPERRLQAHWGKLLPAAQVDSQKSPRLASIFPSRRLQRLSKATEEGGGRRPREKSGAIVVAGPARKASSSSSRRHLAGIGIVALRRAKVKAGKQLALKDARRSSSKASPNCARIAPFLFRLSKERRKIFFAEELSEQQRNELSRYIQSHPEVPAALKSTAIDVSSQEGKDTEQAVVDRLRSLSSTWKPRKTAADMVALRAAAEEKRAGVLALRAEAHVATELKQREREASVHHRLEHKFRRSFVRRRDLTTDQMLHGWRAGHE